MLTNYSKNALKELVDSKDEAWLLLDLRNLAIQRLSEAHDKLRKRGGQSASEIINEVYATEAPKLLKERSSEMQATLTTKIREERFK